VEELRGSPLAVGTLEEMIDDNHAIVSSSVGPEYYVNVLSFVNQDLLEPGCSVLLHNKVMSVVGILGDDTDPMVSVMKVDKAPLESYADIGGLESQIQEIKEAVELPLTHPELYEVSHDMSNLLLITMHVTYKRAVQLAPCDTTKWSMQTVNA
jgi:26S proteasome regulatory subunit T2